jgi:hypothetical protein
MLRGLQEILVGLASLRSVLAHQPGDASFNDMKVGFARSNTIHARYSAGDREPETRELMQSPQPADHRRTR